MERQATPIFTRDLSNGKTIEAEVYHMDRRYVLSVRIWTVSNGLRSTDLFRGGKSRTIETTARFNKNRLAALATDPAVIASANNLADVLQLTPQST
jgi:hypothetical protein